MPAESSTMNFHALDRPERWSPDLRAQIDATPVTTPRCPDQGLSNCRLQFRHLLAGPRPLQRHRAQRLLNLRELRDEQNLGAIDHLQLNALNAVWFGLRRSRHDTVEVDDR